MRKFWLWYGHFCLMIVFALLSDMAYAESSTGRDPTRPSNYTEVDGDNISQTESYNLQSIMINETRRVALINGRYVKVGDEVGNAKVVAIEKNKVVLSVSGQTKIIKLFDSNIRN